MSTEHLILGETTDFLTGKTIADTHDERARQKIARFLVDEKGYAKADIESRLSLPVEIDGQSGSVRVDFVVRVKGRPFMVVLFRPGSMVSRERTALAVARLLKPEIIPYAVITNAVDAELLETKTGKVIRNGVDAISSRSEAENAGKELMRETLSEARREKEKRILFAMEVLTQKECDDYTCAL